MTNELHAALRTEVVAKHEKDGIEFSLARLQHGKDKTTFSIHVNPRTYSLSGVQTTDLLALLGLVRSRCGFVSGQQCYAKAVDGSFELQPFADAFAIAYTELKASERHLEQCGFYLDHPEGHGFFSGKHSAARQRQRLRAAEDGHTAPKSTQMKVSEDDNFHYVFSWIDGGRDKGWVTHYRPKQPPLSREMQAVFSYLGLRTFADCPEFDFEPCSWWFTPYEAETNSIFGGNGEIAHRWFDAHVEHFSLGLKHLLAVQLVVEPFGMSILPMKAQEMPTARQVVLPREKESFTKSTRQFIYQFIVNHYGDNMTTFNQQGQQVNTQYNAGRDINVSAVQNVVDLVGVLEQLSAEIRRAGDEKFIDAEIVDDAEYRVQKAITEAKKPEPDQKKLLDYVNEAKGYVGAVSATLAAGSTLIGNFDKVVEAIQKVFS